MSASTPVSRVLGRPEEGVVQEIITPEGVPIPFTIASAGSRVWAFFIDTFIQTLTLLALLIPLLILGGASLALGMAAIVLAIFVVRNLYFTWFEIRWQGATPGKRRAKIRVIDRNGGLLTPEAIFTRNLTRDLEVWLPLAAIGNPEMLLPGAPIWAASIAVVWLGALSLMPLFNRQRLRVGDMIAGTLVVRAPQPYLERDLTEVRGRTRTRRYEFTDEQLSIYGIFELQVLEDVLRRRGQTDRAAMRVVCEKIKAKIDWDRDRWKVQPERFLRDFYAALRSRLERGMLFGKKRASKHDRRE